MLLVCTLAFLLAGCTDYSYQKATPNTNKITLSETDSRLVLSQKIVDTIATKSALDAQLTVYLQDTVTPTVEMKESLSEVISTSLNKVEQIKKDTEAYNVYSNLVSVQSQAVELMSEITASLNEMSNALKNNDFKLLQETKTTYGNAITKMQGIVV